MSTPNRPGVAALTGAALATALVTACSSGGRSTADPTASASAVASASIAALRAAPAVRTETFKEVTPKEADNLEGVLPLMSGVESDSYYEDTGALTVVFKKSANKLDQQNVENAVRQAKQGKAVSTPTATPAPSSTRSTFTGNLAPTASATHLMPLHHGRHPISGRHGEHPTGHHHH